MTAVRYTVEQCYV